MLPKWFEEARFGMFIHWGFYSLTGLQEQALARYGLDRNEYEALMGAVKLGVVIANADYASNLITIENGEYYLSTIKGLMVEMSSREYSSFSLAIQGFTPESAEKLKLVIASYIIADYDDNDETADTVKYVQHEMPLTESKLIEVNPGIYLDTLTLERIKQEALLLEQKK